MEIVRGLEGIAAQEPCSLALGTFDGLHLGHRAVIQAAAQGGGALGVFTFDSSPSGAPSLLTSGDKETLLKALGVSRLYTVEFPKVRDIPAETFVRDILFARCRARRLVCGEDFRFGKGASGNISLLQKLCSQEGVELTVVPPVLAGGEKVSSTRVRAAIGRGDLPLAARFLGRPVSFSLEVLHGNHIGTGLGTPTINQAVPDLFTLPPFGVYASWVQADGRFLYGVTNIGVKPTVGSDRVLAETWMPEYSGDLYGRRARLFLLRFIRPERKFPSLETLKTEIQSNARTAKEIAAQSPIPEGIFPVES